MIWLLTKNGRELIHDAKLRKMILSLDSDENIVQRKTPAAGSISAVNFLNKISSSTKTLSVENCTTLLLDALSTYDFTTKSKILLLNRTFIIALAYLLDSRKISASDIVRFLNMKSIKTRTEFIISFLGTTQVDFDLFGGLKTTIDTMPRWINEKDASTVSDDSLKGSEFILDSKPVVIQYSVYNQNNKYKDALSKRYAWDLDRTFWGVALSVATEVVKETAENIFLTILSSTAVLLDPVSIAILAIYGKAKGDALKNENAAENLDSNVSQLDRFVSLDLCSAEKAMYFQTLHGYITDLFNNRLTNTATKPMSNFVNRSKLNDNLEGLFLAKIISRLKSADEQITKVEGIIDRRSGVRVSVDSVSSAIATHSFATVFENELKPGDGNSEGVFTAFLNSLIPISNTIGGDSSKENLLLDNLFISEYGSAFSGSLFTYVNDLCSANFVVGDNANAGTEGADPIYYVLSFGSIASDHILDKITELIIEEIGPLTEEIICNDDKRDKYLEDVGNVMSEFTIYSLGAGSITSIWFMKKIITKYLAFLTNNEEETFNPSLNSNEFFWYKKIFFMRNIFKHIKEAIKVSKGSGKTNIDIIYERFNVPRVKTGTGLWAVI